MNGIVEVAANILSSSERRLEIVSHNIANTGTSGFKKQVAFSDMLSGLDLTAAERAELEVFTDFAQGKLSETGNPLDLAITSSGMFKLRSGDDFYYSRQGQFQLDNQGRVTTPQGYILQQMGGGDLNLSTDNVEILQNGTVLEDGLPIARIGLFDPDSEEQLVPVGGTMFKGEEGRMSEADAPVVRQGMMESANVDVADEMVEMMQSLRYAEVGAKLVQVYDTMIGQAISTFGQGSQ